MSDVPLKDYIERILDERGAQHKAHWDSSEKALDAATAAMNARLETMNEFRAQILEERSNYLRRDQLDPTLVRLKLLEEEVSEFSGRFWMLAFLIPTAVAVIISLVVWLGRHLLGG